MFTLRNSSRICKPRVSGSFLLSILIVLIIPDRFVSSLENAYVLQTPFVVDWVDKCMTMVMEDVDKVHPKVVSFMLNLTSYLAANEWMIVRLRELDIVNRLDIIINGTNLILYDTSLLNYCIIFVILWRAKVMTIYRGRELLSYPIYLPIYIFPSTLF